MFKKNCILLAIGGITVVLLGFTRLHPVFPSLIILFLSPEIYSYSKKRNVKISYIVQGLFVVIAASIIVFAVKKQRGIRYFEMAQGYKDSKDYAKSREYYEKALDLLPTREMKEEIFFALGNVEQMLLNSNAGKSKIIYDYVGTFESPDEVFAWADLFDNQSVRFTPIIDHDYFRSTNTAVKIKFDYETDVNLFVKTFSAPVEEMAEYMFSCWIKTDIIDGDICFDVIDRRGWKVFCKASPQFSGGSNGWKLLELNFKTVSGTKEVIMRFRHFGTNAKDKVLKGIVWIDDWKFEKVEQ